MNPSSTSTSSRTVIILDHDTDDDRVLGGAPARHPELIILDHDDDHDYDDNQDRANVITPKRARADDDDEEEEEPSSKRQSSSSSSSSSSSRARHDLECVVCWRNLASNVIRLDCEQTCVNRLCCDCSKQSTKCVFCR